LKRKEDINERSKLSKKNKNKNAQAFHLYLHNPVRVLPPRPYQSLPAQCKPVVQSQKPATAYSSFTRYPKQKLPKTPNFTNIRFQICGSVEHGEQVGGVHMFGSVQTQAIYAHCNQVVNECDDTLADVCQVVIQVQQTTQATAADLVNVHFCIKHFIFIVLLYIILLYILLLYTGMLRSS
jgi:hypothetical protein